MQDGDATQSGKLPRRPEKTQGWNAYLDWAARLTQSEDEPTSGGAARLQAQGVAISPRDKDRQLWEPLFLRARDADQEPDTFFDTARRVGYDFDPFELEYAVALREKDQPVEGFFYRRVGVRADAEEFEASFEILSIGAPVTRNGDPRPTPGLHQARSAPGTAIGIIDDGIAILHPRFRDKAGDTRFRAVWFQTLAGQGQTLVTTDIDAELAQLVTRSEEGLYAARAASLYAPGTHHAMTRAGSHGTLMLDLAAGADPRTEKDMAKVPLYAVQLPPQAFDDTSGYRLRQYLVQGFRWLIYHALMLDRCERLVVSLSLGTVAGPKNGSSFVERQIRREMNRIASIRGKRCVEVVLAYGNAYEERLIARKALGAGEQAQIGLRLQPDDITLSYVEVRLTPMSAVTDIGLLKVTLIAPDGQQLGGLIPPGTHVLLPAVSGGAVAGLYHTGQRIFLNGQTRPAVKTAAFAPTTRAFDGDPICPSGRWTIALENASPGAMDVVIQVQSDDSPFPRQTGARQARLDDADSHSWTTEDRDFTGLLPGGMLTHEGSNSAYSTVPQFAAPPPDVHTIGGALVRSDVAPIVAAWYSSQGADWSGVAPTASAVSETARVPTGLLGAGNFAAATLRLSGTSAAAATFARHLVTPLPVFAAPADPSRLGGETVTDSPAIRRRR